MSGSDFVKSVALKLPADPYMHLVLNQFKAPKKGPAWPAPYDQIGSRAHAFLVKSVKAELERISQDFANVKILHQPLIIDRKWGKTTCALLVDPDGVFLELLEIESGGSYFATDLKAPPPTDKSWLHYMLNTESSEEMPNFYKSFGLVHDHRVDFRGDLGFFPDGHATFSKRHYDAFAMDDTKTGHCDFLRSIDDLSNMHLELLQYKEGKQLSSVAMFHIDLFDQVL